MRILAPVITMEGAARPFAWVTGCPATFLPPILPPLPA